MCFVGTEPDPDIEDTKVFFQRARKLISKVPKNSLTGLCHELVNNFEELKNDFEDIGIENEHLEKENENLKEDIKVLVERNNALDSELKAKIVATRTQKDHVMDVPNSRNN